MPGYLVAHVQVHDAAAFARYAAGAEAIVARHRGRYLIRGGTIHPREDALGVERLVVIEFPTLDAARAFYDDPDYAPLIALRHGCATTRLALVEGVPPG